MIPTEPTPHPDDRSVDSGQTVPAISAVLDEWYSSHSAVRRMWAIEESKRFRIIVALEPTLDGDDTRPIWLANSRAWTLELQRLTDRPVQLDLIDEPSSMEPAVYTDGLLVADLLWRDAGEDGA